MLSSSSTRISFFHTWYTSPVIISPIFSLYFRKILFFSYSWILEIRFCRIDRISLRPKLGNLISSDNSSPTSKSGSILTASERGTSRISSSTLPSSTMILFLQISRSPLSMLTMISKLSADPNLFASMCLKTSSRMIIIVSLSMFLNSLNSEKVSTKFNCSILIVH